MYWYQHNYHVGRWNWMMLCKFVAMNGLKVTEEVWVIPERSGSEIGWHKVKSHVHRCCSRSVAFFSQLFSSKFITFNWRSSYLCSLLLMKYVWLNSELSNFKAVLHVLKWQKAQSFSDTYQVATKHRFSRFARILWHCRICFPSFIS